MAKHGTAQARAFTLIELVGTGAILAILSLLLIPKVFEALHRARINQSLAGCHTIKTATLEHFAKFGLMAASNGVALAVSSSYDRFDAVLLSEGLIDKPFTSRIGTNAQIRIVNVSMLTAGSSIDPRQGNGAYDLDGDGANDIVGAQYVVEAAFLDVTSADAGDLNSQLDGPALGESGNSGQDTRGRLIYNKPHPQGNWGRNMRLYLTHR
jgi:type II secretory pathway pseudopilin PulG